MFSTKFNLLYQIDIFDLKKQISAHQNMIFSILSSWCFRQYVCSPGQGRLESLDQWFLTTVPGHSSVIQRPSKRGETEIQGDKTIQRDRDTQKQRDIETEQTIKIPSKAKQPNQLFKEKEVLLSESHCSIEKEVLIRLQLFTLAK